MAADNEGMDRNVFGFLRMDEQKVAATEKNDERERREADELF